VLAEGVNGLADLLGELRVFVHTEPVRHRAPKPVVARMVDLSGRVGAEDDRQESGNRSDTLRVTRWRTQQP
jgi:hypothetical protein